MLLKVIVYFVFFLLAKRVVDSIRHRGDLARVLAGLRPRHAAWGALVLTTTLVTLLLLGGVVAQWVPALRLSWLTLLTGENGSMFSAAASDSHPVPMPIVIALYGCLLLAMPLLALIEEKQFRVGAERRSPLRNAEMAVRFGLVHLIVGLPVFAALALATAGGWFTWIYRRAYARHQSVQEATFESARAHLANNLLAFSFAVVAYVAAR